MRNATFDSFTALLEEMGRAFFKAARYTVRAMATMSWPALMVSCVALALAITIAPLALFLFIVFMAVKLIVAATVLNKRRGPATPYRATDDTEK
jgi:hypothetical protein